MPSPPVYPTVPNSYPSPSITLESETISKQISINPTLPISGVTPASEYGEVVFFDFAAPNHTITISISHIADSGIAAYVTMMNTPGAVLNITDDAGVTYSGRIQSFTRKRIKGTNLSAIEVTILKQ